jgi:hypothetical protein
VQGYRQVLCVIPKVLIYGKDPEPMPHGGGTDYEINRRSLDSMGSAPIIELCGGFVIFLIQRKIGKKAQVIL